MAVVNEDKEIKKGKTHVQWIAAITANTTLLTHGLQSGWVAPMINLLQSAYSPLGRPLTNAEISWIAGAIPLSACFGVVFFTYIVAMIGRKRSIIIIAAMQALCWIIKIFSSNAAGLIIARVFAGLAGGGCYMIVPVYVREITQDNIRGILGSFIVLFQNLGFLFMFAMGFYMDYYIILWSVVWFPVITATLMLFSPESPAFLVKRKLSDQAAITLAKLRGLDVSHKDVQRELEYMEKEENTYKSLPKITYLKIWQNKTWRCGCYLNMLLMTFRNISGNFAILTFTPGILLASGVTVKPELQSLSFPIVMILSSFVSMSCVDRFGRKSLLLLSFVVGAVSLTLLATNMLILNQGCSSPGWIAVVSIISYFIAYASGISPMPYIIMAEMFNFQIRAKVIGVFVTYAWFITFIQLVAFTSISSFLGPHNVFYCYAVINLIGAIVIFIFLPETKGKTVEEIEMDLKK